MQEILTENFPTVTEKLSKNLNDFTQLWRQWPCLLKVKSITAKIFGSNFWDSRDYPL